MDNKLKVVSVIAAAATGLLLYIYTKTSQREQTHEELLETQLLNLRKQINVKLPTHGEFKKVMAIGIRQARLKLNLYSKNFRKTRKTYVKQMEKEKFAEYMEFLYRSLMDMDKIGVEALWEIGRRIGLSQQAYQRYENEVEKSLQLIMEGQNQNSQQKNELNLEQAKLAVKKQIKLIREQRKSYVNRIIEVLKHWSANKRSALQIILPIIIADASFQNDPNFDAQNLSDAQVKYRNQLIAQLQELEFVMTPMMLEINAALRKSTMEENQFVPEIGNMEELDQLQKKQLSSYAEMAEMIENSSK